VSIAAPEAVSTNPLRRLAGDIITERGFDEPLPPGIDLAVIGGLVDDVTVSGGRDGSTVRMAWPAAEGAPRGPESSALGSTAPPA